MSEANNRIDLNEFLASESTPFLKASDIKGNTLKIKIIGVREADLKYSGRSLLLDVEVKKEKKAFILNRTNIKRLIALFGLDTKTWIGKDIILRKVLVTRPGSGEEIESLRIK